MEGLYLYCIRGKTGTTCFSTKGIDGKGEVFVIPFRKLEAVVSRVSLEEFSSEEIQKKAQENLNWIKEKAVIHAKVIEEAMKNNEENLSIIPMKFGTVYKEEKTLEEALDKHYEQLKETLKRLEGKQEWSIKVYLADKKNLEQKIKTESRVIKEKEKEIASLPEGMAFFMEEELKELISREIDKELKETIKDIFERFKIYAEEAGEGKILKKELTGRPEPMVLNASYLIRKERIEDFKTDIERLNKDLKEKWLSLEYSGPWPPYNFV